MKITIEELEELKDIFNELDDNEYWEQQPQYKIEGFSDYIVYPKQGLIWSLKTNKWVGSKQKNGYWQCTLTSDDGREWNTKVHRAIWIAVNGAIPQGYDVNHIDENKDNQSISNLNLMTPKENNNWGTHNERMAKSLTNRTDLSKQVAAYKDGVLMMIFPSTREAHRQGYKNSAVSACCRNCFNREGNNSYKGYQWRYI